MVRWCYPDPIPDVGPVDGIFHLATPASAELTRTKPIEMFDQIIGSMKSVIHFCETNSTPPVVCFASSGAVYGPMPTGTELFLEGSEIAVLPWGNNAAYAEGKRAAEFMLSEAHNRGVCQSVIARLFAFSGRYLPVWRHFAIGNFVGDAIAGRPIRVMGDGTAVRSYLDGADLAEWLFRAIEVGEEDFAYHIGSDRPVTIRGLAELVAIRSQVVLGITPEVIVQSSMTKSDRVDRYVPDTTRTRAILGVEQKIMLQESIDQMLQSGAEPSNSLNRLSDGSRRGK